MVEWLITGNRGQLGRAVERLAVGRGRSVSGTDLDTLDIADAQAVEGWVAGHRPRVVFNCAAYTAVDACEEHEEDAFLINGTAVGHLADACARHGARLIHISTDYVFDGTASVPYREDDPVNPAGAYGRTKLAGEHMAARVPNHLIVRTAWLYGVGGRNFVEAIRRQIDGDAPSLRVVADQHGCPTFCDDLAAAVIDLADGDATGIVHGVNRGSTTWYGFAVAIAQWLGADKDILPVSTEAFPRPAPRPAYSILSTDRLRQLLGRPMPEWQDALRRYLEHTTEDRPCAG